MRILEFWNEEREGTERLGEGDVGCDNPPQGRSIQRGREMECCLGSPGRDKIKEGRQAIYGRPTPEVLFYPLDYPT